MKIDYVVSSITIFICIFISILFIVNISLHCKYKPSLEMKNINCDIIPYKTFILNGTGYITGANLSFASQIETKVGQDLGIETAYKIRCN